MSAWIVSKTHIDLLVTAGLQFADTYPLSWASDHPEDDSARWGSMVRLTSDTADRIGRMLWAENLASVAYRYDYDEDGERPGPEGFVDADVDRYEFQEVPGTLDPVVVLSSIACYEYQSAQHEAWPRSQALRFCKALQSASISKLPGYAEAPWGFDDRDYFVRAGAGA